MIKYLSENVFNKEGIRMFELNNINNKIIETRKMLDKVIDSDKNISLSESAVVLKLSIQLDDLINKHQKLKKLKGSS